MVSAVQRMACLCFTMPRDSVGKTQTARVIHGIGGYNYLEASPFTRLCLTGKLGSPGTFGWSAYTWPLHVAWTAHRMAAGFQEGE